MICNFCGNEAALVVTSEIEPKAHICFKCLGDALVMIGSNLKIVKEEGDKGEGEA
jgi:hypothetical protein